MRTIAMINQKGGVGKTTSSVNIAAALARDGQRVLLVDLDPQAHATMHLGVEPGATSATMYDVLINGVPAVDALVEIAESLVLLPAHLDLVAAEMELAPRAEREMILANQFGTLRDRFDLLIIDCPPSLGLLTINALAAVEEVFIPLQPHFLALQGLGKLLETVMLVRGVLNPDLRISGILLCLYESGTRLAEEVTRDVREFVASASPDDPWHDARVFETCVRRNIKLAECPSFGKTIFDYAASSHGAEDYAALAREILTPPAAEVIATAVAEAETVLPADTDLCMELPQPGESAPINDGTEPDPAPATDDAAPAGESAEVARDTASW